MGRVTTRMSCGFLFLLAVMFVGTAIAAREVGVSWVGDPSTHGGDLATGTNWDGEEVPEFDPSSKTGPGAFFDGYGEVAVPLTLSRSLYLNSLLFTATTSAKNKTVWDLDLGGKKLQLYGKYDYEGNHALYVFGGAQKVRVQNGTLDFTDALANDTMMVMSQGAGAELVFSGSDTTISGNPLFRCFGDGTIMITNGVQATGRFTSSRGGLTRIAGAGTVLDSQSKASNLGSEQGKVIGTFEFLDGAVWNNAKGIAMGQNGYGGTMLISNATVNSTANGFGVGTSVYASNNVMRIVGGATVSLDAAETAVNKGYVTVGYGYNNLLEVAGEDTTMSVTTSNDGGSSTIRIGEEGWFNTFRVTDKAKVTLANGVLAVGPNENGVFRCDSIGNRLQVSGGAVLSCAELRVGAVMNRTDMLNFYHRDSNGRFWLDNTDTYLHSCSNVFEATGKGTVATVSGGCCAAHQSSLNYAAAQDGNGVRVADGASLTANYFTIGARGRDNFLTVGEGASVTSTLQVTVGGAASSGSTINVVGGALRVHSNYYRFYLKGAASADGPTRLNVSEGGDVYAYYIQMEGHNNRLSISNGTVCAAAGCYFPLNAADDDQTFEFAGTNSVLKMTGASNDFWFRGNTKFVFRIPAEGYCAVPVQGGNNVEISGAPTVEIDARDYFARPDSRTTVLMQAGKSGRLTVSEEALASLDASAREYGCNVKVSSDRKQLLLIHHAGLMLLVR